MKDWIESIENLLPFLVERRPCEDLGGLVIQNETIHSVELTRQIRDEIYGETMGCGRGE